MKNKLNLIPEPQIINFGEGYFDCKLFDSGFYIKMPEHEARILSMINVIGTIIEEEYGHTNYSMSTKVRNIDSSLINDHINKYDAYVLNIEKDCIELYADSIEGFFYGLKSIQRLSENYGVCIPVASICDWADIKLRSNYFDFRSIYPKFENIIAAIKEMSTYKLNTLVIEYEDKAPFKNLTFFRNQRECFTEEEFNYIQEVAFNNFIEIIPLQQSFGHLEYVLKHPSYKHLRETELSVGEMCPHKKGAFELAASLIDEMALLHPHSRYLHIGCDEVWSLGSCHDCKQAQVSRASSFINFVNLLVEKVLSLGKIPIVWHDMLENATSIELEKLDKRVIVCIWIYNGNNLQYKAGLIVEMLHAIGVEVWGANSVRSWDSEGCQNYPVISNRVDNIYLWHQVAKKYKLTGMINTNWASPFALAKPYGLYETSLYPLYYAAELNWNVHAKQEDYLYRFLIQFHGLDASTLINQGFNITDYYQLLPQVLELINKNKQIAKLICVMIDFERPTKRQFPLSTLLYRAEIFKEQKEEIDSLKQQLSFQYPLLEQAKKEMKEIIHDFLTDFQAEAFLASRFYLEDLYVELAKILIAQPKLKEEKMISSFKKDCLEVQIFDNATHMGEAACNDFINCLNSLYSKYNDINIVFAAAPSQNSFFQALETRSKEIDWKRINAFHMDEYIGLDSNAPQGFFNFLLERLFSKYPFKSINRIDGNAKTAEESCNRYSVLLDVDIDIVVMGIGENGHIAFNDPPVCDFSDSYNVKVVELDEVCRMQQVNDGCFENLVDVPTHAITLTIPKLMEGKNIFCIVPGERKQEAVYNTLHSEVSHMCPATILRTHECSRLYLDKLSAKKLL